VERERLTRLVLIAVGVFAVAAGCFLFVTRILQGLADKEEQIVRLQREVGEAETRLLSMLQARQHLTRWQAISLPPDSSAPNPQYNMAILRYKDYLNELCRKHKWKVRQISPTAASASAGRNTGLVPIAFSLEADATLDALVRWLRDFYNENLAHQIRKVILTPTEGQVQVSMTIETAAILGAAPRDSLAPQPSGSFLVLDALTCLLCPVAGQATLWWSVSPAGPYGARKLSPHRQGNDYAAIVRKDLFAGLRPVQPVASQPAADRSLLRYVVLTDITETFIRREAWLYCRPTNTHVRLREEGGFNEFEVRDARQLTIVKGKVRRINTREVVVEVAGKFYVIHLGQTLADALAESVKPEDLKKLYQIEIAADGRT